MWDCPECGTTDEIPLVGGGKGRSEGEIWEDPDWHRAVGRVFQW